MCINCINPSLHNNKRLMGHIIHQRNSLNHLTHLHMIWLYHNVDLGIKKTLSPFQKLNDLYLFKVKSPSPKGAFWLKLADSFLRRKYLNFVNVSFFSYFTIIFPWKRTWTFIWINLNPLHQTMLCAIFLRWAKNGCLQLYNTCTCKCLCFINNNDV